MLRSALAHRKRATQLCPAELHLVSKRARARVLSPPRRTASVFLSAVLKAFCCFQLWLAGRPKERAVTGGLSSAVTKLL